jgi:transcription elongation factor GreA
MTEASEKYYLTKEGYENLQHEYQRLKTQDRPKALDRVKQARELGDLEDNDNPEYEAAREAQSVVEGRIMEIEDILAKAEIISVAPTSKVGEVKVQLGSMVTVEVGGNEQTYTIVGSVESDPAQGRVSHESPVGSNLLGLKEGDVVKVELPHNTLEYKILKIHT